MVALLVLLGCPMEQAAPPEPTWQEHRVVRGDTLGVLARRFGVTVQELQAWNNLPDDRLEVGQILRYAPGAPAPKAAPRPKPATAKKPPRACLPPPSEVAEGGMVASAGLDPAAARAVLSAAAPALVRCLGEGEAPAEELLLALRVDCPGTVGQVVVERPGDWSSGARTCVVEQVKGLEFPPHALTDGDTLLWPLRYTAP